MAWLVAVLLGSLALVSLGWWRERKQRKAEQSGAAKLQRAVDKHDQHVKLLVEQRNLANDRCEDMRQRHYPAQQ